MDPPLTPEEMYALKLWSAGAFIGYFIMEDKALIVREKDKNCALTRKAVVITPCSFSVGGSQREEIVLKCSCSDAKSENSIISETLPIFDRDRNIEHFVSLRNKNACIHVKTVMLPLFQVQENLPYADFLKKYDDDDDGDDNETVAMIEGPVADLIEAPRLIAGRKKNQMENLILHPCS